MVNKDKKQRQKERAREKKKAAHEGAGDTTLSGVSSTPAAGPAEEPPATARIRRERARAASDRQRADSLEYSLLVADDRARAAEGEVWSAEIQMGVQEEMREKQAQTLREMHQAEVESLKSAHASEVESLKSAHASELEELNKKKQQISSELEASKAAELETRMALASRNLRHEQLESAHADLQTKYAAKQAQNHQLKTQVEMLSKDLALVYGQLRAKTRDADLEQGSLRTENARLVGDLVHSRGQAIALEAHMFGNSSW